MKRAALVGLIFAGIGIAVSASVLLKAGAFK